MNYFAIIFAIVFFIIIYPIPLKMQAFLDVSSKKVYYNIGIFKLNIYSGFIKIDEGKIININFIGNRRLRDICFADIMAKDYKRGISILHYATLSKINVFGQIGKSDNAAYVACASGIFNILAGIFKGYIRKTHNGVEVKNYVISKYDEDSLEISINSKIRVSFLAIIFSVIKDLKKAVKKNV